MNNAQFRNLVRDGADHKARTDTSTGDTKYGTAALGSRGRSSVPMTPRSVIGQHSSRGIKQQGSGQRVLSNGEPPTKKFKSTAAPRGSKVAEGYQDRATLRNTAEDAQSDREKKLSELEGMVKEEKIDRATFEKLRDQMGIGGDLESTHLVKGLDFKLLGRVRRGEDLNKVETKDEQSVLDSNVDDELDNVLDTEVHARQRDVPVDEDAPTQKPSETEVALTRDEILRRLKESRNDPTGSMAPPSVPLNDRFKKVTSSEKANKRKFVEIVNGRRREVLVIIDKAGKTKRKTRWLDPEDAANNQNAQPLGMEVPAEFAAKQRALLEEEAAKDEDDDIFQGVGADYNPLQDLDSNSDNEAAGKEADQDEMQRSSKGKQRNYFSTSQEETVQNGKANPLLQDPTILAALKRAAAIRHDEETGPSGGTESKSTAPNQDEIDKHRSFLEKLKQQEREDAQDMDLGFGESRFGDEDDEDGPIFDGEHERGGNKRKRGPKKRKGDKDNVADVMSVIDGRKK